MFFVPCDYRDDTLDSKRGGGCLCLAIIARGVWECF